MNTKLHAVTDANGRPISFFMTAGQVSDYTGAAALLDSLPKAQWMLADRGYDADWFRDALQEKGITPCIPGRKIRNKTVKYDKRRYKRRNRIEIMFGRLKDWRRVATRYDRCPTAFFSAIALASQIGTCALAHSRCRVGSPRTAPRHRPAITLVRPLCGMAAHHGRCRPLHSVGASGLVHDGVCAAARFGQCPARAQHGCADETVHA